MASPSVATLDDVGHYLQRWLPPSTAIVDGPLHWQAEIDPDELEYLVRALFDLDRWLLAEVGRGERSEAPPEGEAFYVVLVGAMLHALELESPGRAAFVDQLRFFWPRAIAAN